MTELDETLRHAESQRERFAAAVRVIVFLALMATALSLREHGAHHHPVLYVTTAYGILAAAGLVLAWRGVFHPLLPFGFVTLEVALVGMQTILMGSLMGQRPMSLASLPVASVIFVVLAHAAMRYRPWLVLYAALLFLTILSAAGAFMPALPGRTTMAHDLVHHQVFPVIMIILTASILFIAARSNRQLLHESLLERIARHRLSRFFAPDIANRLIAQSNDTAARGAVQPVAILFTDIRDFSSIAETLSPDELTEMLGEFRGILAAVIQEHRGVVDKFIGDAALAVFGFPDSTDAPARRCFDCAHAMLERVGTWNDERRGYGETGVQIGIGMHFGDAFVGVVGREHLLEFTVIGDTVNIAERVERLTRTTGADITASRDIADAAGLDLISMAWVLERNQTMAGHRRTIDVYHFHQQGETGIPSQRK